MSFLTAGMLKFLKVNIFISFTSVCLLVLSLWIFLQHSWSPFHQSSPDFKGTFMYYWRIVPMNGNEWLKSRCWILSFIDKLHEMGTWVNSQPSLQMPGWYLLYVHDVHDCLPTFVGRHPRGRGSIVNSTGFYVWGQPWLCPESWGPRQSAVVCWWVTWKTNAYSGAPHVTGMQPRHWIILFQNHRLKHHLCAQLSTFRTESQLMKSAEMEFDIVA